MLSRKTKLGNDPEIAATSLGRVVKERFFEEMTFGRRPKKSDSKQQKDWWLSVLQTEETEGW